MYYLLGVSGKSIEYSYFAIMNLTTTVQSIMTTDVITAEPDDTLGVVKEKIENNLIHHIPVIKDGKVVGIISNSDLNKMEHHFTLFQSPEAEQSNIQIFSTILAKEVMATPVVTIKGDADIMEAVDIFIENAFHAIPVVNSQHNLEGILTTLDLIRFAFKSGSWIV